MLEPDPQLIFLVVFLVGLATFLYKDRNKIQRSSILFYRRTKSGIDKIDALQKRFPRFWKAYSWGAAISGVLSIALATYYIGTQYLGVFQSGSIEESGLSAVLPGLVAESSFQPGVSFIPVEYWLISIGVLMTVHELSHGIVARSEDFEINSVGWIVLGIFPGAFVEPKGEKMLPNDNEEHMQDEDDEEGDDEEGEDTEEDEEASSTGMWDQGSLTSRIKVLGAGSFANYLTAIVFILLSTAVLGAVAEPGDVVYVAEQDYPAAEAGLNNGTLYSINGESITSQSQLQELAGGIAPGDPVTLNTSEGVYDINATEKDGDGHIGIRFGQGTQLTEQYQPYSGLLNWFLSLFETIAVLNIGIGLVNMLPFKPLDGGQIIGGIIEKYTNETGVKAFNYFSIAGMLLLVGTILLSIGTAL
jgi:membrane-associated protease RseP (regulator of RpoE activity)